ncbi:hypothetical protein [Roseovarius sp. MBR-6]|jgi:hypothetical protein|uniref:hypothetical protein n=1 Tax=Roseovarius sp. MBR-6 TaxID=3156459 RepID=UPI003390EDAD
MTLPAMAQAGAWADFETRCVSALENLTPPVVAGLGQGAREGDVTRYALAEGRVLIVDRAPGDGILSCAVRDPDGVPVVGFDDWIAGAVHEGRYVPVAEGRWHSNHWIEPILEIQKDSGTDGLTLRIVETGLEA